MCDIQSMKTNPCEINIIRRNVTDQTICARSYISKNGKSWATRHLRTMYYVYRMYILRKLLGKFNDATRIFKSA